MYISTIHLLLCTSQLDTSYPFISIPCFLHSITPPCGLDHYKHPGFAHTSPLLVFMDGFTLKSHSLHRLGIHYHAPSLAILKHVMSLPCTSNQIGKKNKETERKTLEEISAEPPLLSSSLEFFLFSIAMPCLFFCFASHFKCKFAFQFTNIAFGCSVQHNRILPWTSSSNRQTETHTQ